MDHRSCSLSIADCNQNFRSANLINCNQSDSAHSFYLDLFQCLLQSYIGTQCSFPWKGRGSVITDSNQDCSTKTNPQLERNSLTTNPIQHKIINFINFCIYIHLLSLQMSYKCTREVNRCRTKQNCQKDFSTSQATQKYPEELQHL